MALDLSFMQSVVTRKNVRGFVEGFEDSLISALKVEATGRIMEGQVVVEAVYSKGTQIWSRPNTGRLSVFSRRRLVGDAQDIRIEFTLANSPVKGAMTVDAMMKIL